MKIKYSPVHTDNQNTAIEYVDENTIMIDGEIYEFDSESVCVGRYYDTNRLSNP